MLGHHVQQYNEFFRDTFAEKKTFFWSYPEEMAIIANNNSIDFYR